MSNVKGSKRGIAKNGEYGVKVAFEYIERQCKREHLPVPNITGGHRTRLIQNKYGLPYCYWNGTTHKGAVYKYKGFVLWRFIDLFMEDYRAVHKKTKKPEQLTLFDEIPEPAAVTSKQLDVLEAEHLTIDEMPETITPDGPKTTPPEWRKLRALDTAAEILKDAMRVFLDCLMEYERGRTNGI